VFRVPAAQVVALVQPAELRQAEYYKAMLDKQRGRLEDEIAVHAVALKTCQNNGEVHNLRRIIAEKRREQFEVDRLRQALQDRFFPSPATRDGPARHFDIEITHDGAWWSVQIPEIEAVTKVRRREDVELMAREHIAVIINAPIAAVGVRVVSES
jgi:hypothetical protein